MKQICYNAKLTLYDYVYEVKMDHTISAES
jgi:hypothetical protein